MALKDYGNGIMASSDDLASIGEAFLREEMERQKQRALLRAAFRDGKQVGWDSGESGTSAIVTDRPGLYNTTSDTTP